MGGQLDKQMDDRTEVEQVPVCLEPLPPPPQITKNANILVIHDCFEPLGNPRLVPFGVPSLNL